MLKKKRSINMDKRGMGLLPIMAFVFLCFFAVLFLGVFLYGLGLFDDSMQGLNILINGQNFTQIYQQTTGQGVDAIFAVADTAAIALLFGMIIVMMAVGYFWGDETKKLWILADIFIIIVVFVISVYLQIYFTTFINSSVFAASEVFTADLEMSSTFMAKLPFIVPIAGVLIMIATYGLSRRKQDKTFYGVSDVGY